jgi:ribosome-binding factor A
VKDRRAARLAEEIREEVAELIRSRLKDPRIGFVTVTRVSLTSDQGLARVFVGVLGDDAQRDATLVGLRRAAGFVRRELGRRIRLRQVPEVLFEYDKGLDATDRVALLLDEARAQPAGEAGPEAEPAEEPDSDS